MGGYDDPPELRSVATVGTCRAALVRGVARGTPAPPTGGGWGAEGGGVVRSTGGGYCRCIRSRLKSLRIRYSMRPIWAASSSQWWYAGGGGVPGVGMGVPTAVFGVL